MSLTLLRDPLLERKGIRTLHAVVPGAHGIAEYPCGDVLQRIVGIAVFVPLGPVVGALRRSSILDAPVLISP